MSKHKDKKPKEEVKEESKAPSAEVSETEAEAAKEVKDQEESALHSLTETLANELHSIQPGHREVDLAKEEALKHLEKVSTLIAFIEKALTEKKK